MVGEPNDCASSASGNMFPVVTRLPSIVVFPVISTIDVTDKVVPSNVKFASSSSNPAVPAKTILLSVRLLIVAFLLQKSLHT